MDSNTVGDPAQETGTQKFISDLFATGVNGYVDSQYANNYQVNDPRNFNNGRPAGLSTIGAFTQNPAIIIALVIAAVALVYLSKK